MFGILGHFLEAARVPWNEKVLLRTPVLKKDKVGLFVIPFCLFTVALSNRTIFNGRGATVGSPVSLFSPAVVTGWGDAISRHWWLF